MTPRDRTDNGAASLLVAIVAGALILVAGLVWDGGQLLATYREAYDLAAQAARAAAQGIDRAALDTGEVRLDTGGAEARAEAYLADAGHPGAAQVTVDGDQATVTITVTHDFDILPRGPRQVSATASATATRGVDEPSGGP